MSAIIVMYADSSCDFVGVCIMVSYFFTYSYVLFVIMQQICNNMFVVWLQVSSFFTCSYILFVIMQQIFSNMFAVVGLLYPYQYHRNMTMFGPTRTLLIDSYAIHLQCILPPRTVLSQALQLYISLAYQGERTHLLSH